FSYLHIHLPPISTLFPYTTLFRSRVVGCSQVAHAIFVYCPRAIHPHAIYSLQHEVCLGVVVMGLGGVAKGILENKRQISQAPIRLAVIHQILDLIVWLGPGKTVALLRLYDHAAE